MEREKAPKTPRERAFAFGVAKLVVKDFQTNFYVLKYRRAHIAGKRKLTIRTLGTYDEISNIEHRISNDEVV
jgi:hypothetical protein